MVRRSFLPIIYKYWWIGLFALLTFLLYRPAFSAYFFQDDWNSFLISEVDNFADLIAFFQPLTRLIYYRPLGMQMPFFILKSIFGLNPLAFRLSTFAVHLINGILVYRLLFYILKNQKLSLFGAWLYLTSIMHYIVFFWAATIAFALAPFFYFGSFYLYLKNKQRASFGVFFAGILVNELVVTFPLMLTTWLVINKKFRQVKTTWHYWTLSINYALFRFAFAKFPTHSEYKLVFSPVQVFKNLRLYFLWIFGWPEAIVDQFVSFIKLNSHFLSNFHEFVLVYGVNMCVYGLIMIVIPLVVVWMKKYPIKIKEIQMIIFGLLWLMIGLAPVLFWAHHAYAYYLPIAFLGWLISTMSLFKIWIEQCSAVKKWTLLLLALPAVLWYYSSWQTMKFNSFIHWAPKRAKRAEELANLLKEKYPTLPHEAIVIVGKSGVVDENRWALDKQHGLKVLYGDKSIETFYGTKEDYFISKNILDQTTKDQISSRIFEIP